MGCIAIYGRGISMCSCSLPFFIQVAQKAAECHVNLCMSLGCRSGDNINWYKDYCIRTQTKDFS